LRITVSIARRPGFIKRSFHPDQRGKEFVSAIASQSQAVIRATQSLTRWLD
jgi:hypothetical protein